MKIATVLLDGSPDDGEAFAGEKALLVTFDGMVITINDTENLCERCLLSCGLFAQGQSALDHADGIAAASFSYKFKLLTIIGKRLQVVVPALFVFTDA